MNEIVKHGGAANQALSLAAMTPLDAWKFAEALAGSGMLPRQYQGNPASVLWALEYGRAIGLDVITTTQSVHVIQGRATASADLMASLTRRAGHRMRIVSTDDRAEVTIFRADDPEFAFVAAWDVEKARRAKLLNKDIWQQYQGSMLRARAISECVRMACPEVLHGSIYTPEEIGANVDADGMPIDAPVQPLRVVQAEPVEQREFLREALDAADAGVVRQIWIDAKAFGSHPDYLEQIAEVGRKKAATSRDVVDADVVTDGEPDEYTTAVDELRAAALEAGVADTIDGDFLGSYGITLDRASVAQIRDMTNTLRGAA